MDSNGERDVDLARRKLMKRAIYLAPLVVSVVSISKAGAQPPPTPSCGPAQCNPTGCVPNGCRPNLCQPRA